MPPPQPGSRPGSRRAHVNDVTRADRLRIPCSVARTSLPSPSTATASPVSERVRRAVPPARDGPGSRSRPRRPPGDRRRRDRRPAARQRPYHSARERSTARSRVSRSVDDRAGQGQRARRGDGQLLRAQRDVEADADDHGVLAGTFGEDPAGLALLAADGDQQVVGPFEGRVDARGAGQPGRHRDPGEQRQPAPAGSTGTCGPGCRSTEKNSPERGGRRSTAGPDGPGPAVCSSATSTAPSAAVRGPRAAGRCWWSRWSARRPARSTAPPAAHAARGAAPSAFSGGRVQVRPAAWSGLSICWRHASHPRCGKRRTADRHASADTLRVSSKTSSEAGPSPT